MPFFHNSYVFLLFFGGVTLVVFNIESFDANLELYFISVFIVGQVGNLDEDYGVTSFVVKYKTFGCVLTSSSLNLTTINLKKIILFHYNCFLKYTGYVSRRERHRRRCRRLIQEARIGFSSEINRQFLATHHKDV